MGAPLRKDIDWTRKNFSCRHSGNPTEIPLANNTSDSYCKVHELVGKFVFSAGCVREHDPLQTCFL
jgi:hypothetical protein